MLDDFLHRFYLVNTDGCFLPSEEVTDEDGRLFLIDQTGVFLEFLVVPGSCSQLQRSNGIGIPGMSDAVFSPVKLSEIGQEGCVGGVCLLVEDNGVVGYFLQTDTPDCADFRSEIRLQQCFAQSDALENLSTAITADG